MSFLVQAWYNKKPWLYALTPISAIYRSVVALKRLGYSSGLKKTTHFPVPVIVIGNITVGGTGKTPLIIALANILKKKGFNPGVVSRGYGGKAQHIPRTVDANSDPALVGDEPVLIARNTGCPVVVCPKRVAAVNKLLEAYHCDVVLSDDGLQHYAMGRDVEIAVIDGKRRFGNELCLPAGPLREPINRLASVDFVVTQGDPQTGEWRMQLVADEIYNLDHPQQKLDPKDIHQPIHAVAGIGNPMRFFTQLRSMGFEVIEHSFPDHHYFSMEDIDFGADAIVIMTEKDAIKCEKFADSRHWCLSVQAYCDPIFIDNLLQVLAVKASNDNNSH